MHFRFSLLLVFSLLAVLGRSQEPHFIHYDVDDGLPSSQVYDIAQDDYGYIWFSTDHGICRYDGYSFQSFTVADGATDNTVFNLQKQDDGSIWCTTLNRSLFSISGAQPTLTPYPYNALLETIGPPSLITTDFHRTEKGDVYMSFVNGSGYVHINAKGEIVNCSAQMQIPSGTFNHAMLVDATGRSFFYSKVNTSAELKLQNWPMRVISKNGHSGNDYIKAIYIAKGESSVFSSAKFVRIQRNDGHMIELPQVFDPIGLGTFGADNFWVGLRHGGLLVYDCDGNLLHKFLNGKSVTSCFQDHQGALWISTAEDGVFYARNLDVLRYDVGSKWVQQLTAGNDNRLWAAMYNGDILTIKDEQISKVHASNLGKPSIVYFHEQERRVYYVSDQKLFNQMKTTQFTLPFHPRFLTESTRDGFIVGSYYGFGELSKSFKPLFQLDQKLSDQIEFRGAIYLATESKLMMYDYKRLVDKSTLLPKGTHIRCLAKSNTHLIVGTEDRGIYLISEENVRQISAANGLSSNDISNVFVESPTVLWVSSNAGINRVRLGRKHVSIDLLNTSDGLISNEITDLQIVGEKVWVGSRHGLFSFNKSLLVKNAGRSVGNFLRFTNVKIEDEYRQISSVYNLDYDENRLELDFQAVCFTNPGNLMYRYRLNGLEKKWVYGTSRHVVYASIPPGNYEFVVQTKDLDGKWKGEELKMQIIINAPYWETWWFRSSLVFVILLLIYLFFKYRILSYNKDISRELLRQLTKKIRGKQQYVVYRDQGKDVRILSDRIGFVHSARNYLEIHTVDRKYVVRGKISEFKAQVPDPLEYVRVHRSYIVRLDRIEKKGANQLMVLGETITVSEKYLHALEQIHF